MALEIAILKSGNVAVITDQVLENTIKRVEYYRDQRVFNLVFTNGDQDLFSYDVPKDVVDQVEDSTDALICTLFDHHKPVAYKTPLIKVGEVHKKFRLHSVSKCLYSRIIKDLKRKCSSVVEHLAFNQLAESSILSQPTTKKFKKSDECLIFLYLVFKDMVFYDGFKTHEDEKNSFAFGLWDDSFYWVYEERSSYGGKS